MLNSVNIKSIVIHTKKKAMLRVTQNEIFFWMVRFCFIFKVFWNLSLGEEEAVVGWSVQVGFYSTYYANYKISSDKVYVRTAHFS